MAREERAATRNESGRSERVPMGVARPKLSVPVRDGYVRRWMNDEEGRLQTAEQGGYQFVEDPKLQIGVPDVDSVNRDLGTRVSRVVDKSTGKKAYLMEIKADFYNEDQLTKRKAIDETDNAIRNGKLDDKESRYVPKDGIKIEDR